MLDNKVIYIAGGAGLLGRALSRAVLSAGGSVVIADQNFELIDSLKKELDKSYSPQKSFPVQVDISSKKSILISMESSISHFGKLTSLVNSAYPRNKNYGRTYFDVDYEDFCENVSLHLGGSFLVSQQFAKYFIDSNLNGNIINISSVYGVIAPKFEIYENTKMTMPVEYAAIKSSIIHLTLYMAKYFKNKNIRVNCISPGGILDKQPESFLRSYKDNSLSKGMLDPEDLIGTFLFLLSDSSKYINGQNLIVDDGFTI